MQIVFATTSAAVSVGPGNHVTINAGEHWPASDPVVRDHADLFTTDPRHGLRVSVPLPDEDDEQEPTVEEATAAVEAAQKKLDEAKARAEKEETADAGKSQAPVEQATKAPGEKRTTRRA